MRHPIVGLLGRWLPVAVVLVGLFWEAGTPDLRFVAAQEGDILVRKLGHAAVYGLLAVFLQRALAVDDPGAVARGVVAGWRIWLDWSRRVVLPLAIVVLVAIADELWQGRSPGRETKVSDVLTDLTGGVAMLLLLRSWRYRRSRDPRPPTAERAAIERASATG